MSRRIATIIYGCILSFTSAGLTGCLRVAPKMPKALASAAPIVYSPKTLDEDLAKYHASVARADLATAKTQRNEMIFRIMAQIDLAYGGFELNLSTRRAGAQVTGDAAQLGLSAAATIVGASNIKDILSATSTALQGARISFDKNFFEEKTTESLVSQMRASRKTLKAQILRSLSNQDVTSYPLEAAWTDVVNYYYAGTIPSALVDIASKAGNDAVSADKDLKQTVKELTPATRVQARQAISIRSEYEQLRKAITSGDADTAKTAGDTIVKILTAANIEVDSKASPSSLLDAFRKAMSDAADDDTKLTALNAAVQMATQP